MFGEGYSASSHNLCPYFWGTIFAIISLPFVAITRSPFNTMRDIWYNINDTNIKHFIARYLVYMVWSVTILIWSSFWSPFFLILLLVLWAIPLARDRGLLKMKHRERKPNMFLEMFKGWKNKHCPMMEWEE